MSDYDDEDINDVAADSSDDEEETIRWAYQDAKAALLSEEPNAVACFQRVLEMEAKKGSKTVWGFKALKHLVLSSIQANDFELAARQYGRLLGYSGVVSSTVMEPAIVGITAHAQDPKAALLICQATYYVKKPTMTWMSRCIALLSDVQHGQCSEVFAEALEKASELRKIIGGAAHFDDATRQSHWLSIDAITAEFRFRRREFEEVYLMYRQLEERWESINPGAVAAIYEINAKVLLSPTYQSKHDRPHPDQHSRIAGFLEKAIELYPTADTKAHIRCWRYLAVNRALSGSINSSKLAMPDAFKPGNDAVVRLVTLYIDDHGDRFLAAWEEAREDLADAFLQEFFDECAKGVRNFRSALQEWRHLFDAGLYRECYPALLRLDEDLRRIKCDSKATMEKYAAVDDTRTLIVGAAEIATFSASGRRYSVKASSLSRSEDVYRLAQKIDSQAAAIVCQEFGQTEMRRGHMNYAREQLSRAFTLFAEVNQDRRRECAILLTFCNYFQMCRVKSRVEDDVAAFLGQEECAELKALADALRRADEQCFAQLLQNVHLRFGDFMHDLLVQLSAELTTALRALRTMDRALGLRTSEKLDEQCTLIKTLHATWSRRGLWFHVILVRISAYVVSAPPEVGRNLREIYEGGREFENCVDIDVPALSVLHDSWGRECLNRQEFAAAARHFEKALRASELDGAVTEFHGAPFLALTSLVNGDTLFDQAIARFDRWLTEETQVAIRRFHDAYKLEDMSGVEAAVASWKESNDELVNVAEYYASVLHTKLQLRQLGPHLVWKSVFDRLSHRDLHDVQLACRSFRSIVRPLLRHASMGDIVVSAQTASWRHVWAVQCGALRPPSTPTDRAPIPTVKLVDRLDACCGTAPIPKLVIRGDAAPLDHPQLLECAARHDMEELVLEMDFSGLAYEPLRRFLHSWKSIDSLTVSTPKEADSVCVSDDLLRDAAAYGIEKVSVRCQRAAGITDEGILDFWLSAASRSLEVIRPMISPEFLRRLVQACHPSNAHSEADLTVYASPNDALRQLNWDDYVDCRKTTDVFGTTYEFTGNDVVLELKLSLNEHCRLDDFAREYDVLRATRRRIGG